MSRQSIPLTLTALIVLAMLFLRGQPVRGHLHANAGMLRINHLDGIDGRAAAQLDRAVQLLERSGEMGRWLDLFALVNDPDATPLTSAGAMRAWGDQRRRQSDPIGALLRYRAARAGGDATPENWFATAGTLRELGQNAAALTAYDHALAAAPSPKLGRSDILLARAQLHETMNYPDAAVADFRRALADDDFSAPAGAALAFYRLGEITLWLDENPAGAVFYFRQAAALRPDDQWARLRLGYALYWGRRDLDRAEAAIQQALAIWPDQKYLQWPYFYLGEIYADAGRPAEALDAYQNALRHAPEDQQLQARVAALRER